MAAPKGNDFYTLRKTIGREKEYNPESLLEKFNDYLSWWRDNPFFEEQIFHNKGEIVKGEVKKMRPLTLTSFLVFAEIVPQTFLNYEKKGGKVFLEVCTRIRETIKTQQLEGAAAGFLNPSIIARLQGLTDKSEKKVKKKVKGSKTMRIEIVPPPQDLKNKEE